MIILDVEQGSVEWIQARLAIPTASRFSEIVTSSNAWLVSDGEKTYDTATAAAQAHSVSTSTITNWCKAGKNGFSRERKLYDASKSAEPYLMELLAEWVTGREARLWTSHWAERGTELEPEARRFYEFQTGVTVEQVGFVYRDEDKLCGCSPDGLVGDDGLSELKCPSMKKHLENLLKPEEFVAEHRMQVQGGLWVTGRAWCDLMSYHPGVPPVIQRCEPDPDVQKALNTFMPEFLDELKAARQKLLDMGVVPRLGEPGETPEWARPSVDGVTV